MTKTETYIINSIAYVSLLGYLLVADDWPFWKFAIGLAVTLTLSMLVMMLFVTAVSFHKVMKKNGGYDLLIDKFLHHKER